MEGVAPIRPCPGGRYGARHGAVKNRCQGNRCHGNRCQGSRAACPHPPLRDPRHAAGHCSSARASGSWARWAGRARRAAQAPPGSSPPRPFHAALHTADLALVLPWPCPGSRAERGTVLALPRLPGDERAPPGPFLQPGTSLFPAHRKSGAPPVAPLVRFCRTFFLLAVGCLRVRHARLWRSSADLLDCSAPSSCARARDRAWSRRTRAVRQSAVKRCRALPTLRGPAIPRRSRVAGVHEPRLTAMVRGAPAGGSKTR